MGPTHEDIMSQKAYLKVEEASREKHEYVAGRLFLMAGTTLAHNLIVNNLLVQLHGPVKRLGCRTFQEQVKLEMASLSAFYYPDLMVTCEKGPLDAVFITSPCLVAEVLSPSTEIIDRREKLMAYRTIETLKEYLLISQKNRQIEVFRKNADCEWDAVVYNGSESFLLSPGGRAEIELSLDDVYDQIEF